MGNNRMNIGIMDIGSNSIRLAIYETTPQGEFRLINENKESARLSEKMKNGGEMGHEDILSIVPVLRQFREICDVYGCEKIRVSATAAIRNAANANQIAALLKRETELDIEVLSGEQEAYFGFVGVTAGMDMEDGFIIDIGGGSTEITLFRGRRMLHSVSLPIGAVNAQLRFGASDPWSAGDMTGLRSEIGKLLDGHAWITEHPGLPLIGLGGTIRTLSKLDQRRRNYPLRVAHHYRVEPEDIRYFAESLPVMPLEKRKRLDGLSKSRADIIVPGLIIFQSVFERTGAAYCLVSGSGLREGLLLDMLGLEVASPSDVLRRQAEALLQFQAPAPRVHFLRVHAFAAQLHGLMEGGAPSSEPGSAKLLYAASMLYKVGSAVRYHQYDKHTLYWLTHAPLGALNHREAVLSAFIADFAGNHGKRINPGDYRALLAEGDLDLVRKLGSLVEIAISLDASETQCVESVDAVLGDGALLLKIKSRSQAYLELRQLEAAAKNFKKVWNLRLEWELQKTSSNG